MRQETIFAEQLSWITDEEADKIGSDSPLIAEFIETLGLEGAMRFVQRFGGCQIYIPKLSRMVRERRDQRIRAEFTGANHFDLARRYGLSMSHVREILRREEG